MGQKVLVTCSDGSTAWKSSRSNDTVSCTAVKLVDDGIEIVDTKLGGVGGIVVGSSDYMALVNTAASL